MGDNRGCLEKTGKRVKWTAGSRGVKRGVVTGLGEGLIQLPLLPKQSACCFV